VTPPVIGWDLWSSSSVVDTLTGSQAEFQVTVLAQTSLGFGIEDQLVIFRSYPEIGSFEPDSATTDLNGRAYSSYRVTVSADTTMVMILIGDEQQLVAQRMVTLMGR